jgi:anti-sigma28 factor (negative regulator of flagellin synthesis)
LDISTADGAKEDLLRLQEAVGNLSGARARVDATQNHLTRAIQNLGANIEHLTAAASAIRDADVAKEVTGLKKQLLLVQTCSAIVSTVQVNTGESTVVTSIIMNELEPTLKLARGNAIKSDSKGGRNSRPSGKSLDGVTMSEVSKNQVPSKGSKDIAGEIRHDLVNKFRNILHDGTYSIKSDEIAEKIIQKIRDNKNQLAL